MLHSHAGARSYSNVWRPARTTSLGKKTELATSLGRLLRSYCRARSFSNPSGTGVARHRCRLARGRAIQAKEAARLKEMTSKLEAGKRYLGGTENRGPMVPRVAG